jgi:chromate transporter
MFEGEAMTAPSTPADPPALQAVLSEEVSPPPSISYGQLFVRFLRFGLLAWGGPVAQIAMLRQELVEEQRWVSRTRFNRVLAVYQVLPGPEAHELCVYFGYLARGRVGGLLAGLGFMLPGLVLMLLLSWFYVAVGLASPLFAALFAGCQVAVTALIVRAVHRIGEHVLSSRRLWAIALGVALGQLLNIPFYLILGAAALVGALSARRQYGCAGLVVVAVSAAAFALALQGSTAASAQGGTAATRAPSVVNLFFSGLRAGLLTFGGAYTAIPFVQRHAVEVGGWMTNAQFLDGLALSGILPAPLVIFVTFVGYLGGGLSGALAMTAGMFLPAFAFTLVGHELMEQVVERPSVHAALDGVAAGVVGLIAATALQLLLATVTDLLRAAIFLAALVVAYRWKTKWAVLVIVASAGLLGLLLLR